MAGEKDSFSLDESQTIKTSFKINKVPTNADALTLANEGAFGAGEFVITPDEDENLSQMRTMVLWTNSNPTSSFAQTTITVEDGNYEFFEIGYRYDTSNDFQKSDLIKTTVGTRALLSFTNTPNIIYARAATVVAKNQIQFVSSYQGSGTSESANNNTIIPLYIIGYIKQPAMIYTGAELHEGNGITLDNGTVAVTDKVLGVPSNNNWIDISVVNNSNVAYTAPANGYVMVQGEASPSSMCRVLLVNLMTTSDNVYDAINGQGCYSYNSDNTLMSTTICKKGDIVRIYLTNLTNIRARFVPSEV